MKKLSIRTQGLNKSTQAPTQPSDGLRIAAICCYRTCISDDGSYRVVRACEPHWLILIAHYWSACARSTSSILACNSPPLLKRGALSTDYECWIDWFTFRWKLTVIFRLIVPAVIFKQTRPYFFHHLYNWYRKVGSLCFSAPFPPWKASGSW